MLVRRVRSHALPVVAVVGLVVLVAVPASAQKKGGGGTTTKVTTYATGNAADVAPALHGPFLDLGGGGLPSRRCRSAF